MLKSFVTLGRVTHTYTHNIFSKIIARNCKAFNVPKNIENLEYNCN